MGTTQEDRVWTFTDATARGLGMRPEAMEAARKAVRIVQCNGIDPEAEGSFIPIFRYHMPDGKILEECFWQGTLALTVREVGSSDTK